jgi:hypothetical protein
MNRSGYIGPIELHCIGGFVVSLLYGLPRPTGEVDYVAAIPRYRIEELEQLRRERIKTRRKVRRSPAACHRGNHAGRLQNVAFRIRIF